ncbi:MAG TPA: hypothetical protein VFP90_10225 [Gemmatimonadaceae bacterium]|jgi:hypothetical protein|nr:hypothetical protein [Gemmatimonadaceae bacterium]
MSAVEHASPSIDEPLPSDDRTSATRGERRFEALLVVVYLAVVSFVSARHEPWADETQTWRLAIDTHGLADLYRSSRDEGHPLLFHVLLQMLGHLSRSWWAPVVLHVAIAGTAAWLVARYAPFTRLQKLLLVFGYFPLYEYGVIVRPYGLGMMLTFAACATWTLARRRILWTGVLLALLANTTVMGTLIALTLLLAFVIDWAWPDGEAPFQTLRRHPAGLLVVGVVALAVFGLAALQFTRPALVPDVTVQSTFSLWRIGSIPLVELRAMMPIAIASDGVAEWFHWAFLPESSLALAGLVLVSAIVLAVGCLIAARRRASLVFFVVGTTGFIVFFDFLLEGQARHHGSLFLVWVAAAWLAWSGSPSAWPLLPRLGDSAIAMGRRLFTCSLVLPLLGALEFVVADVRAPFADTRRAVAAIRREGLATAPIIALDRLHAQSVGALLDRPVTFPVERKTRTFVEWGRGSRGRGPAATDSTATALLARECRVIVFALAEEQLLPSTSARGRLMYITPDAPMDGYRFHIWLLTAPPSPRCPSTHR